MHQARSLLKQWVVPCGSRLTSLYSLLPVKGGLIEVEAKSRHSVSRGPESTDPELDAWLPDSRLSLRSLLSVAEPSGVRAKCIRHVLIV